MSYIRVSQTVGPDPLGVVSQFLAGREKFFLDNLIYLILNTK